jgi:hypothetical protein
MVNDSQDGWGNEGKPRGIRSVSDIGRVGG